MIKSRLASLANTKSPLSLPLKTLGVFLQCMDIFLLSVFFWGGGVGGIKISHCTQHNNSKYKSD